MKIKSKLQLFFGTNNAKCMLEALLVYCIKQAAAMGSY